jgi:hypothetical protein
MTLRRLVPLGLPFITACFPTITHGPRVENGFVFGVTAATTSGDTHTEGDEGGFALREGTLGPFIGQGWASTDPHKPSAYLGLVVPLFFPVSQLDLYVQAPQAWTGGGQFAAGLGATGSIEGGSLYTQFGFQPERGVGWQAMGGYGIRVSSATDQSTSPAWVGNVGLSFASGHFRGLVFVQGADGRAPGYCLTEPTTQSRQCDTGPHARAVSIGVSLGRHGRSVGAPP